MGGSASKTARKLPTGTKPTRPIPAWAGARTPNPNPLYPHGTEPPPEAKAAMDYAGMKERVAHSGTGMKSGLRRELAGEEKNEAIRRDSQDPDFLANLSRMGQVNVPKSGTPFTKSAPALQTLLSRSELYTSPSAAPPKNHLTSSLLSDLLDRLKSLPASESPEKLYREYGVDPARMKELRQWVNSPSVDKDKTEILVSEHGEEIVKMFAVWVDSAPEEQKQINQQSR